MLFIHSASNVGARFHPKGTEVNDILRAPTLSPTTTGSQKQNRYWLCCKNNFTCQHGKDDGRRTAVICVAIRPRLAAPALRERQHGSFPGRLHLPRLVSGHILQADTLFPKGHPLVERELLSCSVFDVPKNCGNQRNTNVRSLRYRRGCHQTDIGKGCLARRSQRDSGLV